MLQCNSEHRKKYLCTLPGIEFSVFLQQYAAIYHTKQRTTLWDSIHHLFRAVINEGAFIT